MGQNIIVAGVRNLVIETVMHHIGNTDGLTLAAYAESAAELKTACEKHHPNCVFICPSIFDTLRENGCIEFLQNHSTANLLIATLALEQDTVRDLLASGVKGILLIREVCIDELLTAIDTVAQGKNYISNDVARMLNDINFQKTKVSELSEALTKRELDVAKLVAEGLSSKEIAKKLLISPSTVKVHRRNIMATMGINKATALAKLVHSGS